MMGNGGHTLEHTQAAPDAFAYELIEVPNRNFMSDQPTNAAIIGTDEVFIMDPGDTAGVALVAEALARRPGVRVKAIVLTHAHPDHAIAALPLKRMLNAPIMLNPKEDSNLREFGKRAGDFLTWADVDMELTDGMTLGVEDIRLEAINTPGHSPGHIALWQPESRTLFAGDLVSGMGTVGIFPPHGMMTEYLDSLARVQLLDAHVVIPGHGPTLTDPPALFTRYIERRLTREAEIDAVVTRGPTTIEQIVVELYPDVLPHFRRAAASTVLAHLVKLQGEGRVIPDSDDLTDGVWRASGVAAG